MRRILAGVVSFAVGLAVYIYAGSLLPQKGAALIGFAVALGIYGLIDWLGLLPAPFEQTARTLMHDDDPESPKR